MNERRSRTWLVCLGLVGVFAAGVATGAFGAGAYIHHHLLRLHGEGPEGLHNLGLDWLDRKLDLTSEQEAEVASVVEDVHLALFRFKTEHNDELEAIVTPGLERIDALLTPEQTAAWRPIRERIAAHAAATLHGDQ